MKGLLRLWCLITISIGVVACASSGDRSGKDKSEGNADVPQDILTGSMNVVVDESVESLMNEQLAVFRSSYSNSRIQLLPQPEKMAINTLLKGEATFAILARTLTDAENSGFKQRAISPRIFPVAYDAVVLFTSATRSDSTIDVSVIRNMMGTEVAAPDSKLLFSSINSAAFRYLKELVGVERVSAGGVSEIESGENLFLKVARDTKFIGVSSLNQFLSQKDTLDIFNNLRILGVRDDLGGGNSHEYYKPSQSSLADGSYPLKQTVYVLNYQPNLGLGIGFSAFLTGDRGQRVVLKAGLLPATMPGREIIIRDNINY